MDKEQTRQALEYQGVRPAELEFWDAEEYEGILQELLDVALLGKDIEWAKALHERLQFSQKRSRYTV